MKTTGWAIKIKGHLLVGWYNTRKKAINFYEFFTGIEWELGKRKYGAEAVRVRIEEIKPKGKK
jgi:hypothetical protein